MARTREQTVEISMNIQMKLCQDLKFHQTAVRCYQNKQILSFIKDIRGYIQQQLVDMVVIQSESFYLNLGECLRKFSLAFLFLRKFIALQSTHSSFSFQSRFSVVLIRFIVYYIKKLFPFLDIAHSR